MTICKNLIWVIALPFLFSCNNNTKPLILISKDYNARIENWLKNVDGQITTRMFYEIPNDSMNYFLELAKGIVIGGGEDVNPILYNKPEYDTLCEGYDNFRDSIEFLMINYAMQNKIPIIGICRGNQILNVANGGTLIPDIPTFYKKSTLKHRSKTEYSHYINPEPDSWITLKLTTDSIHVNSRHHQAVDAIAPGFKVAAYSIDSVVESIEFIDHDKHPFAIGVQWHPEGLNDSTSYNIGKLFLNEVYREK